MCEVHHDARDVGEQRRARVEQRRAAGEREPRGDGVPVAAHPVPPLRQRAPLVVGALGRGEQVVAQQAVADDEPAGDPQADPGRLGEQRVHRRGEVRTEHQRRRRPGLRQARPRTPGPPPRRSRRRPAAPPREARSARASPAAACPARRSRGPGGSARGCRRSRAARGRRAGRRRPRRGGGRAAPAKPPRSTIAPSRTSRPASASARSVAAGERVRPACRGPCPGRASSAPAPVSASSVRPVALEPAAAGRRRRSRRSSPGPCR